MHTLELLGRGNQSQVWEVPVLPTLYINPCTLTVNNKACTQSINVVVNMEQCQNSEHYICKCDSPLWSSVYQTDP